MNVNWEKNLAAIRKHQKPLYSIISAIDPATVEAPKPSNPIDCATLTSHVDTLLKQGVDFLYWLGLYDGEAIQQSAKQITKENRGLLVIEPSHERFVQTLLNHDLRALFRNQRIFWATGHAFWQQIIGIWRRTYCCAADKPYLLITEQENARLSELSGLMQTEIRTRKSTFVQSVQALTTPQPWQKPKPTWRIWSFEDLRGKKRFSTIQTALMRTWFYYFQKLGYETQYDILRDGQYYPPYFRLIRLAEFQPDTIFLCNNGPSFEYMLGKETSRSLPVPKIIWYADDPYFGEHLLERYKTSPDEHYFIADYEWRDTLEKYGANDVQYLPGGATKTRMGRKRASRVCDICFVGQVRDLSHFFQKLTGGWQDYARKVIEEKMRFPRKRFHDILEQFEKPADLPMDYMDEFKQHLLWEANTRFRVQVVLTLKNYNIRIYGNEAWLKFLPQDMAKRCFRGIARYQHLFEIYRNARINLNIHSLQTYTCMNVRDFDVPAAGGFLLSDWLPKADETFRPGFVSDIPLDTSCQAEVFFYRTIPELKKLVDYFLTHDDERLAAMERARKKVIEHHTYSHRTEWLEERMGSFRIERV